MPAGSKYVLPSGVCTSLTSTVAAIAAAAATRTAEPVSHATTNRLAVPRRAGFIDTGRLANCRPFAFNSSSLPRLLHLGLDSGRTDQPLHDVIVRLLDAGMPRVVLDVGMVELHACRDGAERLEILVAVDILERNHVGNVDELPLMVVAEERPDRQRCRIDVQRSESGQEI